MREGSKFVRETLAVLTENAVDYKIPELTGERVTPHSHLFDLSHMTVSAKAPIVIVGAGYVGLVTGVGFARAREVRLVDRNARLIEDLDAGRMPISEPELEERFNDNRDRLSFFTDLESALADQRPQLVFIAVGTPKRAAGGRRQEGEGDAANLSAVHSVVDELLLHDGVAVVMKSTVPPGTGRAILERAEARGRDLPYLSCPEFLQEGAAFATFDSPDRIVVGHSGHSWASDALRELHADVHPWLQGEHSDERYMEMELIEAECVKHTSNLALAIRITLANEIGNFCEESAADATQVMKGVGADRRIGPSFLKPGVGFGGSCFDKDIRAVRAVARADAGLDLSLVDTVISTNEGQVERVVEKLERRLGALEGTNIAILGLAFKPKTDDLRGGPAFTLATRLRRRGANLRAWDPEPGARERAARNHREGAEPETMSTAELARSALEAVAEADAVVLATEWEQFGEIDWCEAAQAMRGTLVIDGRNHLDPEAVRAAGLEYEGTGRESRGLLRPLPEGATES